MHKNHSLLWAKSDIVKAHHRMYNYNNISKLCNITTCKRNAAVKEYGQFLCTKGGVKMKRNVQGRVLRLTIILLLSISMLFGSTIAMAEVNMVP